MCLSSPCFFLISTEDCMHSCFSVLLGVRLVAHVARYNSCKTKNVRCGLRAPSLRTHRQRCLSKTTRSNISATGHSWWTRHSCVVGRRRTFFSMTTGLRLGRKARTTMRDANVAILSGWGRPSIHTSHASREVVAIIIFYIGPSYHRRLSHHQLQHQRRRHTRLRARLLPICSNFPSHCRATPAESTATAHPLPTRQSHLTSKTACDGHGRGHHGAGGAPVQVTGERLAWMSHRSLGRLLSLCAFSVELLRYVSCSEGP